MLRRYELTDQEWEQIATLLHLENTGKPGHPPKDNLTMLNGMVWIARSGALWLDLPEHYSSWNSVYSRLRMWIDDGIIDNIFRVFSLEAEINELSVNATIVLAYQHSAGTKRGTPNKIGHSGGGASFKIHVAVEAYGYPVYLILSEGQRNDNNSLSLYWSVL